MNTFLADEDDDMLLLDDEVPDKEDFDEIDVQKPLSKMSQQERAQQVTNKLFELQKKHKEISDKVQSVLVDTVDFAFGAASPIGLKDALHNMDPLLKQNLGTAKRLISEKRRKVKADARRKFAEKLKQRKEREEMAQQKRAAIDQLSYSQGVGSVPYGLPCLAVTRRNQTQQYQQYEVERVNLKLCQIMRVPADFVDVEQESDEEQVVNPRTGRKRDELLVSSGDEYGSEDDEDASFESLSDDDLNEV